MSHVPAVPDHFMPARIEGIEQVTPLIKVFTLAADPQRFRARAGQWLDLAIPGAGEPLVGGYSVVSAPSADGRLQLAIKYADHHEATHHLHTVSRVGDEVFVTAGQGPFYFEPGMSREVVLLGAGIGVTPLMSILRLIHAEAPDVHVHLVYSVASRQEVLFADELAPPLPLAQHRRDPHGDPRSRGLARAYGAHQSSSAGVPESFSGGAVLLLRLARIHRGYDRPAH
jgi:glycine betaine catabolism B